MNSRLETISEKIAEHITDKNVKKMAILCWKSLQSNGGIGKLDNVIDTAREKIAKKQKVSVIEITTAKKFDHHEEALIKKTKAEFGNKNFIVFKINPKIGGGIIIKKDGEIIDKSWKGKISKLKSKLQGAYE